MNGEKAISFEAGGSTTLIPKSVGILLVDGDSTCLTILSKMLRKCGYKVMTAKRATDALCIIREREDEVDVILSEAYLPDMNKYEFLEIVGQMSKLPVIIMSADGHENDILGGLFKGAAFYLVKPITMNNIKNLWQFAFMRKLDTVVAAKGVSSDSLDENMEDQVFPFEVKQIHRNAKRKEPKEMDKIEEEENDDSSVLKKPKLIWTSELHNRFVEAVRALGIDGAHPKKILQYMNVPGLKKENISSHLQKYRLSLKREQDAKENSLNRDYSAQHLAMCNLPSTVNLQGGLFKFPQSQSMMSSCQPELGSCDQKNLNNRSMFMPTLDSAYFLNHAGPSCIDTSNFKYGQLNPTSIGFTYPNLYNETIRTTSHEKSAGHHQIVGSNVEEFLDGKMALSSSGDSGFVSALQRPTSSTQRKDEFLNGIMAFASCGDSGFGSGSQWPTLLAQQQDEERIKQQQQQQGQVQVQLQQQQQLVSSHQSQPDRDHDVCGSERVEIDGGFDMANLSSQLFLDENFNDLW